ncbi:MAG: hypothetical protein M3Y59_18085 [Myxococcota bacterium]|nr:hypothetical protein [Myxococcota bacterium]
MLMPLFMAMALGAWVAQGPAVAPADTASVVPSSSDAPSATEGATSGASPAAEATLAAVEKITVAILSLEGNKAAQDDAPGVASILASTLAESPRFKVITQADIAAVIGVERQRTLMTGGECNTDACMTELAGALGSRYLVAGRLDRYGDKYVLTTSVFDSRSASSLAKPRAEVPAQERLPEAAASMGQQIRAALGDKAGRVQSAGPFSLSLKVGSGFIASLTSFAPSGDLELGYHFAEEWVAVVQVGFKPFSTGGGSSGVNLLPSFVGIRKLHFIENKFQPYWGLGLGVQLALGRFGIFEETGPLPSLWAVGGFQYMFTPHLGALLEGKTNLAQATLGLLGDQATGGFNIDLTAGIHYRF